MPAKTYARIMIRREELATLPRREARVTYSHDDDSPTVQDHRASLTSADRGAFLQEWGLQTFADRGGWEVALGWNDPDGTTSMMTEPIGAGAAHDSWPA